MIVVRFLAFSNAVLLRISKPLTAALAVEIATTSGIATPKACGQEVTITVTSLSSANATVLPDRYQYIKVTTPTSIEIRVSHLATLSARCWVFDFALCADSTRRITLLR